MSATPLEKYVKYFGGSYLIVVLFQLQIPKFDGTKKLQDSEFICYYNVSAEWEKKK